MRHLLRPADPSDRIDTVGAVLGRPAPIARPAGGPAVRRHTATWGAPRCSSLQMLDLTPRARRNRAPLLAAVVACLALACVPAASADTPTAGAVYGDGPSGRFLVGGTWYR